MAARLILNADDFGLTPGINRAIGELHQAAALTSTTLMANGAAWEDAVAVAHANPGLGVGCHVVLVDGAPVSDPASIPSLLAPDGKRFRSSLRDFFLAALTGHIRPEEIEREALAQIRKLHAAGIAVTHLDSHKHTHILPVVARALLSAAQQSGVRAIRNPFEPRWSTTASHAPLLRRLKVSATAMLQPSFHALPQLRAGAVQTTQGTLGISATGSLTAEALRNILAVLPPEGAFELVLHPGYNDHDLDRVTTRLRASRDIEREALLSVFATNSAQPPPIQLIHYADL